MSSNAINNLPTFHTYIVQPDESAPCGHFSASLIGKPIMLRDASERVQVEKNGRMFFENKAPGTAVILMGMTYDASTDQYTVMVAELGDATQVIEIDPSAYDVSPSRPEGYAISEWVRASGKQRERLYRRAKLLGWSHDREQAEWKGILADYNADHDIDGLTDEIDAWLDRHPAPSSNKPAFGGQKRQVNTDLGSLRAKAPVPMTVSRVSHAAIEADEDLLADD